ncbi:transposase [Ectobacillus antri]|uniref:transposase n=1 Tax=Ectobacillus antri TaxID=2486280 RepID=UPI000F599DD9|nr:transposase [Ectobacillus antri]
MKRERRTYTAACKLQMVKLYENGKSRADIAREYDITPSALDRWILNHQKTGSFKAEGHRSAEENELIQLRKESWIVNTKLDSFIKVRPLIFHRTHIVLCSMNSDMIKLTNVIS